ncbi:hypothetical protein FRC10_000361 [Ceratobasidium sp. 414]|nr:hypothetical protein FRC10_000361 [Ceratobasidium sp. 414]
MAMNNPDSIVQSRPQNTSKQTANDVTRTKNKQGDADLNQENMVGGVQEQAGKKKSIRERINLRKASSPSSATHDCNTNPTADSYYPPAEFRSLVLAELRHNCLEWDISRVRIVSATFHRNNSGECYIRLGLTGELGRFNDSHVLTLHAPVVNVPTNKRRLLPRIPGTKNAQKAEGPGSPTSEKVNTSDRLKSSIPQPDDASNELLPGNGPSDTAALDCTSAISSRAGPHSVESLVLIQTAGPTEQTRLLKSKASTTKSTPSIHGLLSHDEHNSSSHGGGDIATGTPTMPTERPTARDGMNILPNDGSAKAASHVEHSAPPPMRLPNSSSQAYTPTALTQSNRDNIATSTQASNKGFSDTTALIYFPADSASAKPSDATHVKVNRRISYTHTDGGALAPHGAPAAQASAKRHRANSVAPNNTDSNPNSIIGGYSLITAPLGAQVAGKRQAVAGIATGAFRVCARTVLDLKANVGAKPRTGCFHIMDACQADKCLSPIQDDTVTKELPMGDQPITLEDVVVLASTLASRASRHTRAVQSENWFLDAMWKGLHLITGSRPTYPNYPEVVDAALTELLDDVMSRFRRKITKFRREISQIREEEDPRGEKRQKLQAEMQHQIDKINKEIEEKILATDTFAKENRELESEMRRLQELMQSEGKA